MKELDMTTKHVPQSVKDRVDAEIRRCMIIAEKAFNRKFKFPTVKYEKRGTTAGTADDLTYTINLNSVLLMENLDSFIEGRDSTVAHEFAHLVNGIVYPETHKRKYLGYRYSKSSPHGSTWKRIMMLFGCDASGRCHTYDTTNSRVKKKSRKRGTIFVRCTCGCGLQGPMGAKRAAKWRLRPNSYFYHKGFPLKEVTERPKPLPVAANKAKPSKKNVKKGTKLAQAIMVLQNNPEMSRVELIKQIQNTCGMSKAGATTYYYNARKAI